MMAREISFGDRQHEHPSSCYVLPSLPLKLQSQPLFYLPFVMGIPFSISKMTPTNLLAGIQQSYFNGKPTWSERDIPDLSGQVIIVTGGNSGLGKETVRALLEHNAKVYMACRSRAKADAVIAELRELTGKEAVFLELDLADLASVRAATKEFLSKEDELHVLYNNGGIMTPPLELVTPGGYDLTFGTNVLGHFYLTKLLLPTLIATAATNPGAGRVVTLTSMIHYLSVPDYKTFKDGPARLKANPSDLYSQSKWACAVFAAELARRYGGQGIISTSVNPGNLKTDIAKDTFGLALLITKMLMIWPVEWGYIAPWGRVAKARKDVDDPKNGKELWEWLEEQVERL
ncbi:hypothetical protein B0H10DRAFT_2030840 [Mycena sp. CBHHK59/15]|nr:hypothetical protein B0H10DRAFT_2030840 [Mycena sp. CBHHK59/15]